MHVDVLAFSWFRNACAVLVLQKSGIRTREVAINIDGITVTIGVPSFKKCSVVKIVGSKSLISLGYIAVICLVATTPTTNEENDATTFTIL